jgi:tetratricopeptide (TPR) repeat protein
MRSPARRLESAVVAIHLHPASRPGALPEAGAMLQQAFALYQTGDAEAAIPLCESLLRKLPQDPRPPFLLGTIAVERGRYADAERWLDRSIGLAPQWAEAHSNRGAALMGLGRIEPALQAYDTAARLKPGFVDALIGRGMAAHRLGRPRDALQALSEAYQSDPGSAPAFFYTGLVLQELGMHVEACRAYDRAVHLQPAYVDAWLNRGIVQRNLREFDRAIESLDQALLAAPARLDAWQAKAHLLWELRRLDEAAGCVARAEALRPGDAETQMLASEVALSRGDYARGWRLAEARWSSGIRAPLSLPGPPWLGDFELAGKTLLVVSEGGFGDVMMYARFVPQAARLCERVVLVAPRALVALLGTLPGAPTVVAEGEPLPAFDCWTPVMSLPLALGVTRETLPAEVPYLSADASAVNAWRERLGPARRLRVGLAWSCKSNRSIDLSPLRNRSVPLAALEPLWDLPVDFHVVQNEVTPQDLEALRARSNVHLHLEHLRDFAATGALVNEMDVTLTVDTSLAHLAGALARPAWVLLPWATDFKWDGAPGSTPWYPTAQLFRQASAGDWQPVIDAVRERLSGLAGRSAPA